MQNRGGGDGNSSANIFVKLLTKVAFFVPSSTMTFSHRVRPRAMGLGIIDALQFALGIRSVEWLNVNRFLYPEHPVFPLKEF